MPPSAPRGAPDHDQEKKARREDLHYASGVVRTVKPGTVIASPGDGMLLILGVEGGRYAVAPVVPLSKRRLAGDVPLDQGMARTSQAMLTPDLPAGAAEVGSVGPAVLAECVKQAGRTAAAEAGLKRFRPLTAG